LLLTETSGVWAPGVEAVLPADAASPPAPTLVSVSCASAGNCSAVGTYTSTSGTTHGLLLTESSGVWAPGVRAGSFFAGGPDVTVRLYSVSCASAGNCAAVGTVTLDNQTGGLMLTQTSGVWAAQGHAAIPPLNDNGTLPDVDGLSSVSCASVGNCTAVGYFGNYVGSSLNAQGLLVTETSGVWAPGVRAVLPADADSNPDVDLISVSCSSAGDCAAAGTYGDSSGNFQTVLLTQTSGAWGTGVKASLPDGAGPGTPAATPPPFASWPAVSCPSAGHCTAVGTYVDGSSGPCPPFTQPVCPFVGQGLLLTQTSGAWATGVKAGLPSDASDPRTLVTLSSVSCSSAGNCAAVGTYQPGSGNCAPYPQCPYNNKGVLLTESSGAWAPSVTPDLPAGSQPLMPLNPSVSCPAARYCTAVGDYFDSSGKLLGVLLSAAPASPAVSAAAPAKATVGGPISAASISAAVARGSAPIGTITFTVFGPRPAPPASCTSGGRTVGSATVSGNGKYHPSADFTPTSRGHYWWHASYSGDASDNQAASACGAAMAKTTVAAPALSAVRLGSTKFTAKQGTTLRLTVSQAARIRVVIGQTVKGRKVKGGCNRRAATGKRCATTLTKRTLTLSARGGANAFKLKLGGLAAGAYTATITAQYADGTSRAITLKFTIMHS
jgi:hypothetical protein